MGPWKVIQSCTHITAITHLPRSHSHQPKYVYIIIIMKVKPQVASNHFKTISQISCATMYTKWKIELYFSARRLGMSKFITSTSHVHQLIYIMYTASRKFFGQLYGSMGPYVCPAVLPVAWSAYIFRAHPLCTQTVACCATSLCTCPVHSCRIVTCTFRTM